MSAKNAFLKVQTYDEFVKRKEEFKDLDFKDEEVARHYRQIFENDFKNGIITEVYKHPIK